MSTVTEAIASANESVLSAITAVQDRILDLNRDMAAAYAKPSVPVPGWVPAPDAAATNDLVEQVFAFRSKLIEADKEFTLRLLDAWKTTPKASGATKK
jgi:hypothetical protein